MKQSEIKELSLSNYKKSLATEKKTYFDLNMAHAISPLENPLQIRSTRRTVARLQTAITQRQQEA